MECNLDSNWVALINYSIFCLVYCGPLGRNFFWKLQICTQSFTHLCCRKGFDTDRIKSNAPVEFNETLGEDCYLVALTEVSEKEIHQRVEEEIAVAERAMRKKATNSKRSSKQAEAEGSDPVVDLLSEDEVESGPKQEEAEEKSLTKEQLKRKRADEKKALAEDKKRQKQEEMATKAAVRVVLAKNNKAMKLATSASPQLLATMEELSIQVNASISKGTITQLEKDTAADLMKLMREWKHACATPLEQHGADPAGDMELPFDSAKMVQDKLKAAKNLVAQLRKNK